MLDCFVNATDRENQTNLQEPYESEWWHFSFIFHILSNCNPQGLTWFGEFIYRPFGKRNTCMWLPVDTFAYSKVWLKCSKMILYVHTEWVNGRTPIPTLMVLNQGGVRSATASLNWLCFRCLLLCLSPRKSRLWLMDSGPLGGRRSCFFTLVCG